MKKDIKINFLFPPDKEDRKATYEKINKFAKETLFSYINNLNCTYEEKVKIFNHFLLQNKKKQ